MTDVEVHWGADDRLRSAVAALAAATEQADGVRFLSDHLWLDLHHGDGLLAAARHDDGGSLVSYAQASPAHSGSVVESAVAPAHRGETEHEVATLTALFDAIAGDGGGQVTWWVHGATDRQDAMADRLGLSPVRDLLQMRRRLPTGLDVTVTTRPFAPGHDEGAWLAVNNRAFADHGEQGGWNLATLQQRMGERWFDPAGFHLHEREGRLAAFCWTKLHPDTDPPVGEIYVVAVDPDFQGLGLGRQLTLAGLESIHARGIGVGILYVDAGNTAAVAMYEQLGFQVHRTDRAYEKLVVPAR